MHLQTLLQLPSMQKMRVIAGERGLNREINNIGMIESPDIASYLTAHQFLITNGYPFINTTTNPLTLIKAMHQANCAGLGFKDRRYVDHLPSDVLALADDLNFPIIVTPADELISETMRKMLTVILNSQTAELSHIVAVNQTLADLLIKDPADTTVLNKCTELIGHPLFLMDSHFRVVSASKDLPMTRSALTDFLRNQTQIDYFNLHTPTTVAYNRDQLTIMPLFSAYKENKAFVGMLNLDADNSTDQMLAQVVLNSLSFVNSRVDMLNESAFRNQSGFYLNVMDGGISNELVNKTLKARGIEPTTKFHCATILVTTHQQTLLSNRLLEQVQQLTLWFIKEHQAKVIAFSLKQQLVLLINDDQDAQHFLAALVNFIQPRLDKQARLIAGYSYSTLPLTELATIYNEAAEALALSKNSPHAITIYRPKYVKELISLIPSNEAKSFVERVLGGLVGGVSENEQLNLLNTLYGYFYYHQNIAEVAGHLAIHRNTVIYRLKKVEKMLTLNLDDPEQTQTLEMAVLLWHNRQIQK
ncbi:PucR family transcriptional regulator [Lactiplantibacillus mudanjiangensis]|uniref:Purine transport regulator [Lactobacillus plantarum JDM1] n=1 Tax=Lactiplantibacillus mudanjiangensis TaxID=1296538 RepID=A0A660E0X5_9LACO|nr:PucR family transcriptional regulator [Lactiplantibacillus mudanjiangensis]VDG18878.1 purine transport regulator [Lactobacillus plantarum JDM1] [Lactiplantibacillus mudanjiangensis]VDG25342.1 purine transport regulator [Lactobacillus plantarum JDM1] [Lactiplantibacillus mudanjiangensis]VDG27629.1 purine transport regulator [Lactobacillus plantarum JDM1] [Lactiplantibacillus mudanjiangensis]VDG32977.1 purine transport regulator [Lactobacillus plantarum JDM1] [Lactiplantibacillus mudanjiangens